MPYRVVLFQEKQFCERGALPVNSIKLIEIQCNIWYKIQNNHRREVLVTKLCQEKPTLFQDKDKLLYYKDWVYIPPDKKLWEQLLNDNHNAPIAGHPGVFKTVMMLGHNTSHSLSRRVVSFLSFFSTWLHHWSADDIATDTSSLCFLPVLLFLLLWSLCKAPVYNLLQHVCSSLALQ